MDPDLWHIGKDAFGATPDTSFYFLSRSHREAFTDLIGAIEGDRPFAALVGKPGTGKTTLLFRVLEQYRNSARTAFIFQSQCNARELMQYLLTDCDIELPEQDIVSMHAKFNEVLIETHRSGKRFLLLLDEAHNFDEPTIESIRLLSDFETPKKKLLQIIFSGQPALDEVLARPGMVQVRQRISLFRTLEPLESEEVSAYIAHRLKIVGVTQELFSLAALRLIADLTGGIPREIHNVCFAALAQACTMGRRRVNGDIIYAVARDLRILPSDEGYEEETITEGPPEGVDHEEPKRASAATAISPGSVDRLTPTSVPDVTPAEIKPDFFAIQRSVAPGPTEARNHPSSSPKEDRGIRARGKRKKMRAKWNAVIAACAILSGCALYAWVEGVNGKVNSFASAQTPLANSRTDPAESTPKPVIAAKPPRSTKRRSVPQIASQRTDSRSDLIDRGNEMQASGGDANPPTAVAGIETGANANESLAAAVMRSIPATVEKAPTPVSSFVPSKLIESPQPAYPSTARNAGISGEVELEAIIQRDGTLRDIRVVKGHPLLTAAAIRAAEQQRYSPYLLNGVPQEVSTRVRFLFKR
jgi:TonB family protein